MRRLIKLIPISGKILIVECLIYVVLLGVIYLPLPKDECGNVCGVMNSGDISDFFFLGLLLVFILTIIELIWKFIKKLPKKSSVVVFVISLFLSIFFFLPNLASAPPACKIYGNIEMRATKSIMRNLWITQGSFYIEHQRYADTQDELIEAGVLTEKIINPFTNQEFTDKDGKGIEGGDNDPETWSITAYIPKKDFKWCKIIREGFWYECGQDGCRCDPFVDCFYCQH